MQKEVIQSIFQGNDTLALMPTGGGKSLTFQVPALAKDGICIVVTPLIALMKDQVENLKDRGIKATAIYAGMTMKEIDISLDNCIYGDLKFLYVSPERLQTDIFRERVTKMNVNIIAVDEAHCISQWGYDFRPSYLEIAKLREIIPETTILALTATATPEVAEDIMDKLGFKEKNLLKKSFERKNLVYLVRETEDKLKYLLKIVSRAKGTGVVYVRSRKRTQEIAQFLMNSGQSSDFYHAGLSNEQRNLKQKEWKTDITRIMVSTNAFGMGIDKSDVRFVVHMDLPDSIEAYFQEAGRGGRDEKLAYAILLYNNSDKVKLNKRIRDSFPEIPEIKSIYHSLGNFFNLPNGTGQGLAFDFNINEFVSKFKHPLLIAFNALKHLQSEGYIEFTEELNHPSKITFLSARDDLYKFQLANPQLDGFIKLLLRSYTGLFTNYAVIDEDMLARKAYVTHDSVYNYLKILSKLKIINYIPKKKTPQIIYLTERLDEKNLYISPVNYKVRKERFVSRIESMLNYADEENKCRSEALLSYFGENKTEPCGECDICKQPNELNISKYIFNLIIQDIKSLVQENEKDIQEITDHLNHNEEKTIKVIQWLLDNDQLVKNQKNKLRWNK